MKLDVGYIVIRNKRAYNSETRKYNGKYIYSDEYIIIKIGDAMSVLCKTSDPHDVLYMRTKSLYEYFDLVNPKEIPIENKKMKLKKFIKQFVEPNTLIRLWYKVESGHEEVISGDKPQMEWELKKGKYKNMTVVGVTDILYGHSPYVEAVNLTIEREQYADKPVNLDFYETVNTCSSEDMIEYLHKELIEISKIPKDEQELKFIYEVIYFTEFGSRETILEESELIEFIKKFEVSSIKAVIKK